MASEELRCPNILHAAVRDGNLGELRRLLEWFRAGRREAEVNARDWDGRTPLLVAAGWSWRRDTPVLIVRALIDAGADVNAITPVNESKGSGECTPLMVAASEGIVSVVKLLLEAGAAPNRVNARGWTALTFATRSFKGAAEKIALLLEAGVDPQARDRDSKVALDLARERLEIATSPDFPARIARLEESSQRRLQGIEERMRTLADEFAEQFPGAFTDWSVRPARPPIAEQVADEIVKAREVVRLLEQATTPE